LAANFADAETVGAVPVDLVTTNYQTKMSSDLFYGEIC
jgi:hypothetical protein